MGSRTAEAKGQNTRTNGDISSRSFYPHSAEEQRIRGGQAAEGTRSSETQEPRATRTLSSSPPQLLSSAPQPEAEGLRRRVAQLEEELKAKDARIKELEQEDEKKGEKMIRKMATQTQTHLKTIASQARQINQLESELKEALKNQSKGAQTPQTETSRGPQTPEGSPAIYQSTMPAIPMVANSRGILPSDGIVHLDRRTLGAMEAKLSATQGVLEQALSQALNLSRDEQKEVSEVLATRLADLEADLLTFNVTWERAAKGAKRQTLEELLGLMLPGAEGLRSKQGWELHSTLSVFRVGLEQAKKQQEQGSSQGAQALASMEELQSELAMALALNEELRAEADHAGKLAESARDEANQQSQLERKAKSESANLASQLHAAKSEIGQLKEEIESLHSTLRLRGIQGAAVGPGPGHGTHFSRRTLEVGGVGFLEVSSQGGETESDYSDASFSTNRSYTAQHKRESSPVVEDLKAKLKEAQHKHEEMHQQYEDELSQSNAQRLELHEQVVKQLEELSMQNQTVSDLTEALRQAQEQLEISRAEHSRAEEELRAEVMRVKDLETRNHALEEERSQRLLSKESPEESQGNKDPGNQEMNAELEETKLRLQAAKENVHLVREGMGRKISMLEQRYREREEENRHLREQLGLDQLAPRDKDSWSPVLSAFSSPGRSDATKDTPRGSHTPPSSARVASRGQMNEILPQSSFDSMPGKQIWEVREEDAIDPEEKDMVARLRQCEGIISDLKGRVIEAEESEKKELSAAVIAQRVQELTAHVEQIESGFRSKEEECKDLEERCVALESQCRETNKQCLDLTGEKEVHVLRVQQLEDQLEEARLELQRAYASDQKQLQLEQKCLDMENEMVRELEKKDVMISDLNKALALADDALSKLHAEGTENSFLSSMPATVHANEAPDSKDFNVGNSVLRELFDKLEQTLLAAEHEGGEEDAAAEGPVLSARKYQSEMSRKDIEIALLKGKMQRIVILMRQLRDDTLSTLSHRDNLISELKTKVETQPRAELSSKKVEQLCRKAAVLEQQLVVKDEQISVLEKEVGRLMNSQHLSTSEEGDIYSGSTRGSSRNATRGELMESDHLSPKPEELSQELERTRACVEILSRDLEASQAEKEELRRRLEKTRLGELPNGDSEAAHRRSTQGSTPIREEKMVQLQSELEALRQELRKQQTMSTEARRSRTAFDGMSADEKSVMITELKSKVSELYAELQSNEETILLLTKKHEILKKNMRSYKEGITAKVNQLREQLQEKEEELGELKGKDALKAQSSREGDLGEDLAPLDMWELRDRNSRLQEMLHAKEEEVRELLLAGHKSHSIQTDNLEIEQLERMLVDTQQKVVSSHQRIEEVEGELRDQHQRLKTLRVKVARGARAIVQAGTISRVLHHWYQGVATGAISRLAADQDVEEIRGWGVSPAQVPNIPVPEPSIGVKPGAVGSRVRETWGHSARVPEQLQGQGGSGLQGLQGLQGVQGPAGKGANGFKSLSFDGRRMRSQPT